MGRKDSLPKLSITTQTMGVLTRNATVQTAPAPSVTHATVQTLTAVPSLNFESDMDLSSITGGPPPLHSTPVELLRKPKSGNRGSPLLQSLFGSHGAEGGGLSPETLRRMPQQTTRITPEDSDLTLVTSSSPKKRSVPSGLVQNVSRLCALELQGHLLDAGVKLEMAQCRRRHSNKVCVCRCIIYKVFASSIFDPRGGRGGTPKFPKFLKRLLTQTPRSLTLNLKRIGNNVLRERVRSSSFRKGPMRLQEVKSSQSAKVSSLSRQRPLLAATNMPSEEASKALCREDTEINVLGNSGLDDPHMSPCSCPITRTQRSRELSRAANLEQYASWS